MLEMEKEISLFLLGILWANKFIVQYFMEKKETTISRKVRDAYKNFEKIVKNRKGLHPDVKAMILTNMKNIDRIEFNGIMHTNGKWVWAGRLYAIATVTILLSLLFAFVHEFELVYPSRFFHDLFFVCSFLSLAMICVFMYLTMRASTEMHEIENHLISQLFLMDRIEKMTRNYAFDHSNDNNVASSNNKRIRSSTKTKKRS